MSYVEDKIQIEINEALNHLENIEHLMLSEEAKNILLNIISKLQNFDIELYDVDLV